MDSDKPEATQTEDTSQPPPARRLLTPREAAAYLGTTEKALENWRGSGAGPVFVRLSPKCIRYAAYDLDAYIWESRRKHTAEGG